MKKLSLFLILSLFVCLSYKNAAAQKYAPVILEKSDALQNLVDKAAAETLGKFAAKNLKAEDLAITLIDLRDPKNLKTADFNGERKMYPASVVKLFYLAALHQWFEDGKLKPSPALERATKDMIVISSNEATQYIVDALTQTSNGEELSADKLKKYGFKRDAVNRYYAALGYKNINVNQKTYGEDLYGRERQFWDAGKNRNMLTTDATARLLTEIVLGRAVSADRSRQMLELLKRDFSGTSADADDQAHGFTAIALNDLKLKDARLWSKAGWTSTARHDAAYVETPEGLKFVLVTFTQNQANERGIIPNIARFVLENLSSVK